MFGGGRDLLNPPPPQLSQNVPVALRVGGAVGGIKKVPSLPGEYAVGCPSPATEYHCQMGCQSGADLSPL